MVLFLSIFIAEYVFSQIVLDIKKHIYIYIFKYLAQFERQHILQYNNINFANIIKLISELLCYILELMENKKYTKIPFVSLTI